MSNIRILVDGEAGEWTDWESFVFNSGFDRYFNHSISPEMLQMLRALDTFHDDVANDRQELAWEGIQKMRGILSKMEEEVS